MKKIYMVRWASIFLIFSVVAAVFTFGGIAAPSVGIAQPLFYIFLGLFVLSLLNGFVFQGNKLASRKNQRRFRSVESGLN